MGPTWDTEDQKDVWRAMERITGAWVENRLDSLRALFHERMVIVAPGLGRAEGRDASIQTFEEFLGQATVQDFQMEPAGVDVFGDTAIVLYNFDIRYEMKGEEHHDRGQDLFVFTKKDDEWLAVWRTMTTAPPP